jgi:hypothetical protein
VSSAKKGAGAALLIALLWPGAALGASIQLRWTAPGDDGNVGRATSYDLRYSLNPIKSADTLSWWSAATRVTGVPAPSTAGTRESFTVAGLDSTLIYYFMIRTSDEVPNVSGFSNVVARQGGSAPIESTAVVIEEIHGYPNPARDKVTFLYQGGTRDGAPGHVRLVIFDLTGHKICELLDGVVPAGQRSITWGCRSDRGFQVAPGLYNVIFDGPSGRQVTRVAIVP